jgi:hypothetical protein
LIAGGGRVSYELYPQDWVLREGHRIGVLLSSGDTSWFQTYPTGQTVTIKGGKVELPFLKYLRTSNLEGKAATAMEDVPTLDVEKSEMKGRSADADWPPQMQPR